MENEGFEGGGGMSQTVSRVTAPPANFPNINFLQNNQASM
jgi:hypothetical protein